MKVVFSHPTGNANSRAAVYGLAKSNLLSKFHTSIATFSGTMLDKLSEIELLKDIKRRSFDLVLQPYTQTWPWRELGRLVAPKVGLQNLIKHESGPFCIDAVYHSIDRRVARQLKQVNSNTASAVYAYEDGAAFSFREAKKYGLQCLYDLPTGYWRAARRLLAIEKERWPEWAETITGFQDSHAKLARKDEELKLADCIIVASQFTARTLMEFPGQLAPIHVIPYGFPPVVNNRIYSKASTNQPLKLLFVGKLSQQKGIADLFAAVDALGNHVKLTVVGQKACETCAPLNKALTKHRWIPSLHYHDILELMQEHDILVFPSLFDGFGLVITEAMSQGTPVIATDRSAGPSLIQHDINGWLVEAGSPVALQMVIERLLKQPEVIAEAGRQAVKTAAKRPWSLYWQELVCTVKEQLMVGSSA